MKIEINNNFETRKMGDIDPGTIFCSLEDEYKTEPKLYMKTDQIDTCYWVQGDEETHADLANCLNLSTFDVEWVDYDKEVRVIPSVLKVTI